MVSPMGRPQLEMQTNELVQFSALQNMGRVIRDRRELSREPGQADRARPLQEPADLVADRA